MKMEREDEWSWHKKNRRRQRRGKTEESSKMQNERNEHSTSTYFILSMFTKCHIVMWEASAVPMNKNVGYTVSTPTSTLLQFCYENEKEWKVIVLLSNASSLKSIEIFYNKRNVTRINVNKNINIMYWLINV